MKILHVGKYYPPYLGGMETVLENQVLGLLDSGHEVSVLVSGSTSTERTETIGREGGSAVLTRLARLGVLASQPLTPGLVQTLHRILQSFQPDLVHLHFPNPLLAWAWQVQPWLTGGRPLPPMLVWHHADITRQRLGRMLVAPVVKRCLAQARGISVAAEGLAEGSSDLAPFRAKVRVIPFGLPPEPWVQVAGEHQGPFLFIGRLVPYKGIEVLLEAMAQVPGARLVLVGDGPLAGSLRRLVSARGLDSRVELAGRVPRNRLLDLMATARGLVLPSLDSSETFGLVQLEAMAAGLPVIASDLPTGIRQVGVPGRTCLLTPPGDAQALAARLQHLLAEPDQARSMGEAGRERFLAHFTRQHMITQLADWYATIC
jgi:glycosyltransferase involved in cell wall biosynthesis